MWFRFQNDSISLSDGIGYTTYRINLPIRQGTLTDLPGLRDLEGLTEPIHVKTITIF